MPIEYVNNPEEKFFSDRVGVLINTVNCVGVMGKGIALEFKNRFPKMYYDYVEVCNKKHVEIGRMHKHGTYPFIINFPTKQHWKNSSKYAYIVFGLNDLRSVLSRLHYHEVVHMPALGCSNGGLQWDIVKLLIEEQLEDCKQLIKIFPPGYGIT
jgi:O-acetyl-ADP-ribose deacetylase (regulator of RNase III)